MRLVNNGIASELDAVLFEKPIRPHCFGDQGGPEHIRRFSED